jgi:hypothetical protein
MFNRNSRAARASSTPAVEKHPDPYDHHLANDEAKVADPSWPKSIAAANPIVPSQAAPLPDVSGDWNDSSAEKC